MLLTLSAVILTALFVIWLFGGMLFPKDDPPIVPYVPPESFSPALPASTEEPQDTKDCGDFFDKDDAQKYYLAQGGPKSDPSKLDLDKDGKACENYHFPATPTFQTPEEEEQ